MVVQFKDALKRLEGRLDADFYGLNELFKPAEAAKEEIPILEEVVIEKIE